MKTKQTYYATRDFVLPFLRQDESSNVRKNYKLKYILTKIILNIVFLGLQIVFSLDEVAFIQNLVFYIESAYCVPVSNYESYAANKLILS